MKFLLLLLLTGCASISEQRTQDTLSTAVTTATAIKVVEKVKEVFTPKYPLIANPSEVCDITSDPVVCWVIPCAGGECKKETDREEWMSENPRVVTVQTTLVPEIVNFCKHNKQACEKYAGYYRGSKIVLVKTKEE